MQHVNNYASFSKITDLKNIYNSTDLKDIGTFDKYLNYLNNYFIKSDILYHGDFSKLETPYISTGKNKFGDGFYLTNDIKYAYNFGNIIHHCLVDTSKVKFFKDQIDFFKIIAAYFNINKLPSKSQINEYTKHLYNEGYIIHIIKTNLPQEFIIGDISKCFILGSKHDINNFNSSLK